MGGGGWGGWGGLEQMGLRLAQLHVKQGHICHQKKEKLVKKNENMVSML